MKNASETGMTNQAIEKVIEHAVQRAVDRAVEGCVERSLDKIADKLLEQLTASLADMTTDQRIAVIAGFIKATLQAGDGANVVPSQESAAPRLSEGMDSLVPAAAHACQEGSAANATPLLGLGKRLGLNYGDGLEYQRNLRGDN